jgi:hypothetical protein
LVGWLLYFVSFYVLLVGWLIVSINQPKERRKRQNTATNQPKEHRKRQNTATNQPTNQKNVERDKIQQPTKLIGCCILSLSTFFWLVD